MIDFAIGQRWISRSELNLGLGLITNIDFRTLTINFPANNITRIYAKETSPLARITFHSGDTISTDDQRRLKVIHTESSNNIIFYVCTDSDQNEIIINESQLSHEIILNRPSERLFNAQIDEVTWFNLRQQTLSKQNQLFHSDLYGITGNRTRLIPHQLYIAHNVSSRCAPRVLLADEVGLGKTIEAGMIMSRQLITGQVSRVLIIVPESLQHQWLVEMLRRFNRKFRLFNYEQVNEIKGENPFETEQLILCSIDYLCATPSRIEDIRKADFDMLIVDEAHHLQWSETASSLEYQAIEILCQEIQSVLLLTATPEQLGKESHYARLRLLDPSRFPSLAQLIDEEERYQPVAEIALQLLNNQAIDITKVETLIGEPIEKFKTHQALLQYLLDRHGTGRIFYRNSRHAIPGFPKRLIMSYPLPKRDHSNAKAIDPRINWLGDYIRQTKPEKTLLITHDTEMASFIMIQLKKIFGIRASLFTELMTLLERDRAAASFADAEDGSPLLVCSEIGSEGRNFQFLHHLILFDLPQNPDLLEQRIGRLDRIGQGQNISIHIPYLQNSPDEILFHWYHYGINALQQTCPAGNSMFDALEAKIQATFRGELTIENLIEATKHHYQSTCEKLTKARCQLLEYNSCQPDIAATLVDKALEDANDDLQHYMEQFFDVFGIHLSDHSQYCYIIKPGENMLTKLSELPEDGLMITYDRNTALAKENVQFLTWEHPLVLKCMDIISTSELGNTAVSSFKHESLAPGKILIESLFILQTATDEEISARFLPPTTIRLLIDNQGNFLENHIDTEAILKTSRNLDENTANGLVSAKQLSLRKLLKLSEKKAKKLSPAIIDTALNQGKELINNEINRLLDLQKINPNIRKQEIDYYQQQLAHLSQIIANANLHLDAVRVLLST